MKNKLSNIIGKTKKTLEKPELLFLPASITYYIMLAIVPMFTILVLVASQFSLSISSVVDFLRDILPEQAASVIIDVISGRGFDTNVGIFTFFAFIVSADGMYAIIVASNTLYKVEKNNIIKDRVKSFILLFVIITLFLFMIVIPVFGDNILSLLKEANVMENIVNDVIKIFNICKWPITFIIIYFNIKLIYTIAAISEVRSGDTTYGALFTTVIWVIATWVFKLYITYFARYDILYGNLSSIIVTMFWLYILSYIFVFGMTLNAMRYEERLKENNFVEKNG